MLRRAGVSLVELLVALSLGGVVLAVAGASLLRQQRATRWVEGLAGAELQLRPVLRLLADELTALDAGAGDLAAGQASDSSLQLRALVAASLTCDSAAAVTLVPDGAAVPPLGGAPRAPAVGDSLWMYGGDSVGWRGHAVVDVARVTSGCGVPTLPAGATWRIVADAPAGVAAGTPLRVTRWERWVIYRAGDGRWYLGLRDWNPATARWIAAQPVAGPFARTGLAGTRTGFRYFDAAGDELVPDGTNEPAIARVRVTALSDVAAYAGRAMRVDSADVVLARRGVP